MSLDKKELKKLGLKVTRQRLKILRIFKTSEKRHLSADDLYLILQKKGEDIGIATVYRVLLQFASAGIIQKLDLGREQAVYELSPDKHHDHMICISCNKVQEYSDPVIERRQIEIVKSYKAQLYGHSSLLYIRCSECNNPE